MEWRIHRVALSDHYKDTLADICYIWDLTDLADALLLVDELERARARANAEKS